jgi:uncharacterized protein with HEPN domain
MKNPAQRLRDIRENIDAIESFVPSSISEASRRLPKELRDRYPSIDWAAGAAAGNVYRHEYEAVDEAQLWHTVRTGLSPLREMASAELDRLFPR